MTESQTVVAESKHVECPNCAWAADIEGDWSHPDPQVILDTPDAFPARCPECGGAEFVLDGTWRMTHA